MYYMCFACTNETYSLNSSGAEVIQHLRLIGQKAFGQSPVGFHFGQAVIA